VIRALEIVGEAAGRISGETRASRAQIPWREITKVEFHDFAGLAVEDEDRRVRVVLPSLKVVASSLALCAMPEALS
jgi:uncharacterized protein with HEPN domain